MISLGRNLVTFIMTLAKVSILVKSYDNSFLGRYSILRDIRSSICKECDDLENVNNINEIKIYQTNVKVIP